MMKFLRLKVRDFELLLERQNVRILRPYEMRFTNDNLIRAIHVGEPIVDLGTLVGGSPSSGKIGVLFKNGFGILADDVTEFEEQVTVEEIDPLVLKLKGNITKAIGKINSKLIPIASFESIFTDEFINTLSSLMSQGSWI